MVTESKSPAWGHTRTTLMAMTLGRTEPVRLEPDDVDRSLIRASILEIADFSRKVVRVGAAGPASVGSKAHSFATSPQNLLTFGRSRLTHDMNTAVLVAAESGADHLGAFVVSLQGNQATVSLATLVRGALESFAQANYFLRSPSMEESIRRYVSVTDQDLVYPVRLSRFQDRDGTEVSGKEYPERLHRLLSELGLQKAVLVGVPERIKMLLRPAMTDQNDDGPLLEVSSQLSGAAHCHMSALGMYLVADGTAALTYPREIALEHTGYLFAAVCSIAEAALDFFGLDKQTRDQWAGARMRAERALQALVSRTGITNLSGSTLPSQTGSGPGSQQNAVPTEILGL
jgi:hypothetical protein